MPSTTSGNTASEFLAIMARAAVSGDALAVRAAFLELNGVLLAKIARPEHLCELELCIAAGFVGLLAEPTGQSPPVWAGQVPGALQPHFLLKSA